MAKVTADLELRSADALATINQLEQALITATSGLGDAILSQIESALGGEFALTVAAEVDGLDVLEEIADAEVAIDVDTSQLDAVEPEIEAIQGEQIEVAVEVDTSQVEEASAAVENLSQTATVGLEGVGGAASEAAGGLGSLAAGIGLAEASSLGAVGTIGGLAAGVALVGTQAIEAEGSLQAFNLRTGDFAEQIRNIDVGGLNEDLSTLAIRLGSSDEGLQNAAARIFDLATASGLAGPAAAEATEQIVALAARAVALNPQLGEVGDVADGLTNALSRGGRFLANYGLSLTQTEIVARALADTGKELASDLTVADRAAAGAAITTERLGTSLSEDVNAGAQNAQIQLRSIIEQFGELLEAAGQPIIVPLFDLLESLQPLLGELAEVIATIGGAALTALDPVLDALLPIVSQLGEAIGEIVVELTPALSQIGKAFAGILADVPIDELLASVQPAIIDLGNAVAELLVAIAPIASQMVEAFADSGPAIATVIGAITDLVGLLSDLADVVEATHLGTLVTTLQLAPLYALAAVLSIIEDALGFLQEGVNSAADAIDDFGDRLGPLSGLLDVVATGLSVVGASAGGSGLGRDLQDFADQAEEKTGFVSEAFDEMDTSVTSSLDDVGTSLADARTAAEDELTTLANVAVGTRDIITQALQDLNEDGSVSLFEFTTNLQTQAEEQATFLANIRSLWARGAEDLALALLQGGADAHDAAAEAAISSDEILAEREASVDASLGLDARLEDQAAALGEHLVNTADQTAIELEEAGGRIGEGLHRGVVEGLEKSFGAVEGKISETAALFKEKWQAASGIVVPAQTATAGVSGASSFALAPGAITIHVSGAGDPGAVADAVADRLPRATAEAMLRMEVLAS